MSGTNPAPDAAPDLPPPTSGGSGSGRVTDQLQTFATNAPPCGKPKKTWKPSDRDLWIYRQFTAGVKKRHIAVKLGISHSIVHRSIARTSEHITQEFMEDIRRLRGEHSSRLLHIHEEAMAAWRKSKRPGVTETVTTPADADAEDGIGEKTVKTVHQCGNPSYLAEARAALAEIRKIHGVDAKPQDESPDDGTLERVAGIAREVAIRQQIEKLTGALTPSAN